MGHMTTLTILNDEYYRLEKNPKMLFDAIDDAMHGGKGGVKGIKSTNGYVGGNLLVAPTYKESEKKVFFCHGNDMSDLGKTDNLSLKEIQRQLSYIKNVRDITDNAEADLRKQLQKMVKANYDEIVKNTINCLCKRDIVPEEDIYQMGKMIGHESTVNVSLDFLEALRSADISLEKANVNESYLVLRTDKKNNSELYLQTNAIGAVESYTLLTPIENLLSPEYCKKLYDKINRLLN